MVSHAAKLRVLGENQWPSNQVTSGVWRSNEEIKIDRIRNNDIKEEEDYDMEKYN